MAADRRTGSGRLLAFAILLPLQVANGDLLHHDFGTLTEHHGETRTLALVDTGRAPDPEDTLAATAYVDIARNITAKVAVMTFADTRWLPHELVGEFMAKDGMAFDEGVGVYGDGPTRRLESRVETSDRTTWVVGWPTIKGNKLVRIELSLKGRGRADEVPTEIVDEYLTLHPSALPAAVADTREYRHAWLKEELSRLLAYAQRNLGYTREPMGEDLDVPGSREQWRAEAVRLLRRFVALRQKAYGVGDEEAFTASFQKAEIDAITPEMSLDKSKMIAFTEKQLRDLQAWWAAHQSDVPGGPAPSPTPRRRSAKR